MSNLLTSKRFYALILAIGLSFVLLGGFWVLIGSVTLAAPLHDNTVSDPEIQEIMVTASFPISDTNPDQGIAKTVYFNNTANGIITLTFEVSGTSPLTFTSGAAFGFSATEVITDVSPFFTVVTYTVAADSMDFLGVAYEVTNANAVSVTVPISYVRDITAPMVSIVNPTADEVFTNKILVVTGIAEDNPGGAGVQYVYFMTDTTWITANGTTIWDYTITPPVTDGLPYTLSAYAVDYLGIPSVVTRTVIAIDNHVSNPDVLASTVSTNTWINVNSIPFTWTQVMDYSSPVTYYYALTTTTPYTVTAADISATTNAITLSVGSSGIYTFYLRTKDGVGNWAVETMALGPFKVDITEPEIEIVLPGRDSVLTTTHTPTYTISGVATDTFSGIIAVSVTIGSDVSWYTAVGTETWVYIWDLPVTDNNIFTITVKAVDNVGNSREVSRSVWVDTVVPIATVPVPDKSPWITSTVVYTWSASSDGAGIREYQVQITNTESYNEIFRVPDPVLTFTQAFSEGIGYYARVRAVDLNGNVGELSEPSIVVTPDLSAPSIEQPGIIGGTSPYLHVIGTQLYYTNTMDGAGAVFRVSGYSHDALSGVARVSFSEAFGDSPPDAMSGFSPWQSGLYVIESGDNESGVITATVYDQVRNTAVQTYTYELDDESPVSLALAPEFAINAPITVTWVATDTQSGVYSTTLWYKKDGPWTPYATLFSDVGTFSFTPPDGDGLYLFATVAMDNLRNVEGAPVVSETQTLFDTGRPESVVTLAPEYRNSTPITMTWVATTSLVSLAEVRLWYRFDDGAWISTSITSTALSGIFVFTPTHGDGLYYFATQARDMLGKIEPVPADDGDVVTVLDTTTDSPMNLTAEPDNWTNVNAFTVTWDNPTDLSGIAGAYYSLAEPQSATAGTWVSGDDLTTLENITVTAEGEHTLWVWLADHAGNADHTIAQTVSLRYDATITGVQELTVSPEGWTNVNAFTVTWDNPTDLSGIAGAYYSLAEPQSATAGIWVSGDDLTTLENITVTAEGEHTLWVWLADHAGNADHTIAQTVFLRYDITPPTVYITVPVQWASSDPMPVEWSAMDPEPASGGLLYTIDYSKDGGVSWTSWLTNSDESSADFTDIPDLDVGEYTYTFRVTARDSAGNTDEAEGVTEYRYFRVFVPLLADNYKPFVNGSFENGLLGWNVTQSPLPVSVVNATRDTGPFAGDRVLLLGDPNYACNNVPIGYAAVEQTFTVPTNTTELTFRYIVWSQDASMSEEYDRFEVYINNALVFEDGNKINTGLGCGNWWRVPGVKNPRDNRTSGWAEVKIDLTDYQGETITLSFRNHSRYDSWYNTYTYVDAVQIETP